MVFRRAVLIVPGAHVTKSVESISFAARWVEAQQAVGTFIAACGTNFHDTEDLLQKTAVIALEKYADYDPQRGPFLAWVIGIARYQIMNWRRTAGRDRHIFATEVIDHLAAVQSQPERQLNGPGQEVAWCIEKVRGRSRSILELRYMECLKPAQIAERIGSTSGSVRGILNRARKSIRDCVQRRLRLQRSEP